jgi:hypothetical protein
MSTIRVFIRGGIGNQLFQYACGLYLARRQRIGVIFHIDLLPEVADSIGGVSRWPSQLSEFNCNVSVACWRNQPQESTHLLSKGLQLLRILSDSLPRLFVRLGILSGERNVASSFSTLPNIKLVDSYCSSSIPAQSLGQELRDQVSDITNPSVAFLELIEEARSIKPVMVHIRLGDYRNLKHLYGVPQFERIAGVVKVMNPGLATPVWIFSDSPEEIDRSILEKLGATKVIGPSDLARPIENLVLMSRGSGLICSNSTFSWWAAFMMGDTGQVFYPDLDNLPNRIFSGDLVLEGWQPY